MLKFRKKNFRKKNAKKHLAKNQQSHSTVVALTTCIHVQPGFFLILVNVQISTKKDNYPTQERRQLSLCLVRRRKISQIRRMHMSIEFNHALSHGCSLFPYVPHVCTCTHVPARSRPSNVSMCYLLSPPVFCLNECTRSNIFPINSPATYVPTALYW